MLSIVHKFFGLVAPYCAIPRLSQPYPPIAGYGGFGVSTWPIGYDTPSSFSARFALGEPPQKGYLSDTCTIPYQNKAKCVRDPPLRYYLES